MFKNKIVVITGDAQGIGLSIRQSFEQQGALVYGIDIQPGSYYQGDIADTATLESFVHSILNKHEKIDYLINNALPKMVGIHQGTLEDFNQALKVGITAPFYLTQLLLSHFSDNASIINISSSRAFQSQKESESYSAAKGAISALTHSLAVSLAGKVRVNAIAPGWIDTQQNNSFSQSDYQQHLVKRVGKPADIAEMVLFLCSDKASFITGQTIQIDGGMGIQMIYHGDEGWSYQSP